MSTSFTSWEEKLNGGPNDLEHHGIPGMKHGVRRYQNEDGSLTALGQERYGVNGTGRSARKMARDFNRLDQSYANLNARRIDQNRKYAKYKTKTEKYALKKGYIQDPQNPAIGKDKKVKKLAQKTMKAAKKSSYYTNRMMDVGKLQFATIGKAAQKGYTVSSKAVKRYGMSGKDKVSQLIAGGVLPSTIRGIKARKQGKIIGGSKVKIKKKGNGTVSLVNYNQSRG